MLRLKILSTFNNPDDVESYLAEMRVLKPLIVSINDELLELAEQEKASCDEAAIVSRQRFANFKVVELPRLVLGEIEHYGALIISFSSLFEWTQKFHISLEHSIVSDEPRA